MINLCKSLTQSNQEGASLWITSINDNINSDVQLIDLKNDDPNHYLLCYQDPEKDMSEKHEQMIKPIFHKNNAKPSIFVTQNLLDPAQL